MQYRSCFYIEEMSHLYLPWGTGERCTNRPQIRNQFASTLELHKQSSYEYQEPIQRQRSPSLPPIHHIELEKKEETRRTRDALTINRNISSAKRFAFYDEDCEGDTSGYGSETINHMNTRKQNQGLNEVTNTLSPVIAWQQESKDKRNRPSSRTNENTWSARSPGSGEEGRPRWGDRGVATGRLWEPTVPDARLPQMQNQKKGTPSWVERGLNMIDNTAEVLVIDQRSSSTSGFDCDRSSCNGSDEGKTYLRGQNVPLEPEIKAQRENKRMKALELQSAILSQLEDQEKRKQEERERKLKEERLEELRIQRQQEEDRLRLEDEKRRNEEKQLIEQRKLETLKKALEEAERKAKQEKEKRFVSQKQNRNFNNVVQKPVENTTSEPTQRSSIVSPTKSNRTYDINSAKSIKQDCHSQQTTEFNSPRSMSTGNLNLFIHSVPPLALENNSYNIVPIGISGNGDLVQGQSNCVQLAVLVPQNMGNNVYNVSLNPAENNNESTNSGKILTPRKYRTLRTKDAFTQTDCSQNKDIIDLVSEDQQRNIDKDYPNIDENAPQDRHHISKKDRRFGSEERFKKDIENRPKWGVNRPVAQYKKQSEKDPFYSQKRKIRQKYRPQARQYLSHSSDDSRSPSPFPSTDKQIDYHSKPRNSLSQSYWRNKRSSQDLTDIIIGQLSTHETSDIKKSPKMSPSKRITLSQKFINDKYGNRKLWVDETIERTSKPTLDLEVRKKMVDH